MNRRTSFYAVGTAVWAIAAIASLTVLTASSQTQNLRQAGARQNNYTPEVKIEVKDGYRYITSNGIPDHATGRFPNAGNPNSISPQRYSFRVTANPKQASQASARPTGMGIFGVAVNGIPFDPGTAELWNGDQRWHYEALSGILSTRGGLGVDENLAHVQPNGAYHYHGLPFGLLKKLNYTARPALVGYAADGFPIYGNYGYSRPADVRSPVKKLRSSYRVKNGSRPGGSDGPGGACDGSFAQDYEYVQGLGDLDRFNGRAGITPEYPNGTYYYVLTDTFPFVPRQLVGTPDPSFSRRGPGGPGGPGFGAPGAPGFGGQGGPGAQRGPGGFGGPGGQGFGGPGGAGRPFGPPSGFVPAAPLARLLGLTKAQQSKLELYVKTIDAFRNTTFALPAFAELNLTEDQMTRIVKGARPESVLTKAQRQVFDRNQRPAGGPGFGPPQGGFGPGFGPPGGGGGPGGPGGFGGPPQGGPGR